MSRRKIVLILAILVAGCAGVTALLLITDPASTETAPPVTATGISMFGYSDAGTLAWETSAASGTLAPSEGALQDVDVRFFSGDETLLTASGARLDQNETESRLHGGVVVERADGLRLQTDALQWMTSSDRLEAGEVHLDWEEISLIAGGLSYDLGTETAFLREGVDMAIDRDTAWSIRAETAEISQTGASLEGGVEIDSEDEAYRCERVETDARGETVQLLGAVEATLAEGSLTAESVTVSQEGLYARDRVMVRLSLASLEEIE